MTYRQQFPFPRTAGGLHFKITAYKEGAGPLNTVLLASDVAKARAAGISIGSCALTWAWIESSVGVFSWTTFDQFASTLRAGGLRPLFVLGYNNPLYYDLGQPVGSYPDAAAVRDTQMPYRDAYVQKAVQRYGPGGQYNYGTIFSTANETNDPQFAYTDGSVLSVDRALVLETATVAAVRSVSADAWLIGTGLAPKYATYEVDTNFMRRLAWVRGLDGVAVHTYRSDLPGANSFNLDLITLRTYGLPVCVTEHGYKSSLVSAGAQVETFKAWRADMVAKRVPIHIWHQARRDSQQDEYVGLCEML